MVKEEEKKSKDKKNWPYWMLEGKNACIPVLHNRSVHHYCKDRQLGLIRAKATCEGGPHQGATPGRGEVGASALRARLPGVWRGTVLPREGSSGLEYEVFVILMARQTSVGPKQGKREDADN